MQCRAIPYEGNEPYIFFSYCHKDADRVYPMLEQMVQDGHRIWYDDGNHAGDDWVENIAQHLNGCTVCAAMLSANSEMSHNCKNEMNFAVKCQKKIVPVMLEQFAMTLGMKMQLGLIHYLNREDYPSDGALLQKLYESDGMKACRGIPGSLPMRDAEVTVTVVKTDVVIDKNVAQFISGEKGQPHKEGVQVGEEAGKGTAAVEIAETAAEPELTAPTEDVFVLHLAGRSVYWLHSARTRLGRGKSRCDFAIPGNPSVSSYHADILCYPGSYCLRDAGSTNGTYVRGRRLGSGEGTELRNQGLFRISDEELAIVYGDPAQLCRKQGSAAFVMNHETKHLTVLPEDGLYLDRDHRWQDGTLNSGKTCARIVKVSGEYYLEDLGGHSGIGINGNDLPEKERKMLSDKDEIQLGDTILEFGFVKV